MGPQPFGCGRLTELEVDVSDKIASMGPQPFGCGRMTVPQCAQGRSRSFNGAATFRLRKASIPDSIADLATRLQWGRNLSVAEGACHSLPRSRTWCFNGAATFRLRKGQVLDRGGRRIPASMGPQPFGCGRLAIRARLYDRPDAASMGPQPFGCGRITMGFGP